MLRWILLNLGKYGTVVYQGHAGCLVSTVVEPHPLFKPPNDMLMAGCTVPCKYGWGMGAGGLRGSIVSSR